MRGGSVVRAAGAAISVRAAWPIAATLAAGCGDSTPPPSCSGAGTACAPTAECQIGTIVCEDGAPICAAQGPLADGTPCRSGVCHAGACTACAPGESCESCV